MIDISLHSLLHKNRWNVLVFLCSASGRDAGKRWRRNTVRHRVEQMGIVLQLGWRPRRAWVYLRRNTWLPWRPAGWRSESAASAVARRANECSALACHLTPPPHQEPSTHIRPQEARREERILGKEVSTDLNPSAPFFLFFFSFWGN